LFFDCGRMWFGRNGRDLDLSIGGWLWRRGLGCDWNASFVRGRGWFFRF